MFSKDPDDIREYWRHANLPDVFGEYLIYEPLDEDVVGINLEKLSDTQSAYREIKRLSGEIPFYCDRLPFSIDCTNDTMRDVPFLNAKVMMNDPVVIVPFTPREQRVRSSIPKLREIDLVQLNQLYHQYRGLGYKLKVGPSSMRRVIKYEDLIVARIYDVLGYEYPEDLPFNEVYVRPNIYCRSCQLSLFQRMMSSSHCLLCLFTKLCRFSSNLFELKGHFRGCLGDHVLGNVEDAGMMDHVQMWMFDDDVELEEDNDDADDGYSTTSSSSEEEE